VLLAAQQKVYQQAEEARQIIATQAAELEQCEEEFRETARGLREDSIAREERFRVEMLSSLARKEGLRMEMLAKQGKDQSDILRALNRAQEAQQQKAEEEARRLDDRRTRDQLDGVWTTGGHEIRWTMGPEGHSIGWRVKE
jgi:hypothetical protein